MKTSQGLNWLIRLGSDILSGKDIELEEKGILLDFSETTFLSGFNADYGKVTVKLELSLEFFNESNSLKLGIFVGFDKMYKVCDMETFLQSFENGNSFYLSKNFIFEPTKMCFSKTDVKVLEFLNYLIKARKRRTDYESKMLYGGEVVLEEAQCGKFLDTVWEDRDSLNFHKQSDKVQFENDVHIKTSIENKGSYNLMNMDYSENGDFYPLTLDFKYIAFYEKGMIVKLDSDKREVLRNLFSFKNNEHIVSFRIDDKDKKQFHKNFIERYKKTLGIVIDKDVEREINAACLLSRAYFDVSPKGIVSKIEFNYAEKSINPLDDFEIDRSFREFDRENEILSLIKQFGFRAYGRLFLLDDTEKIMFLLTDKLIELKKTSEVYYSEDFKKLHAINLGSIGLSLSSDESLIYMNINLENISDEELIELLDAIKNKKKYYRLKNGSIINLGSVESEKFIDFLSNLNIDKRDIKNGLFEIPLNKCLYIQEYLKEKGFDNVEIEKTLSDLMDKVSKPMESEIIIEGDLNEVLRNYQKDGVKWLNNMAKYSFGGILADDMGLGKTLQVLAFILSQKERKLPCLVVAPSSIIYNWKMEAEKFAPHLKVLVVTGIKEKRSMLILTSKDYDLIVTSYGALRNDHEDYQKMKFSYIFVDEAQNIKNPLTINSNSVKSLKSGCCFAITGTPIENRLTELWSIFDFVMPGFLKDKNKFAADFEEPIVKGKNAEKSEELSRLIKPFILRRLKRDVLTELPEKIETSYLAEMKEEQKKIYAAYYKSFKEELISQMEESDAGKNHIELLAALTRLRQICAHPATFMEDYDGGSGKLELAMDIIIQSINSGHSILVFSQFTKILKIIRYELENRDINYYYLDGSMKPEERMMEIDNFNSEREAVFLISLKAGGTGLNLTKADIIIHFDPWWNPAVEDQASDRAHRMGQKKVVQVYKLLTEGTIEERIAKLQDNKRDLIESIIKPGDNYNGKLWEEELRELFL